MDKQGSKGRKNDRKSSRKRRIAPSQLVLAGAIVFVLILLFGFSSLLATGKRGVQQTSSSGSDDQISGIRQVASSSAVVNFGDLARQEVLNPRPPQQTRLVPEPRE